MYLIVFTYFYFSRMDSEDSDFESAEHNTLPRFVTHHKTVNKPKKKQKKKKANTLSFPTDNPIDDNFGAVKFKPVKKATHTKQTGHLNLSTPVKFKPVFKAKPRGPSFIGKLFHASKLFPLNIL